MSNTQHAAATIEAMHRRLRHAWCLVDPPDRQDAQAALAVVVEALIAEGWAKPDGLLQFHGDLTLEQAERFRAAFERHMADPGRWSYVVHTPLPPWWRRLLRRRSANDG